MISSHQRFESLASPVRSSIVERSSSISPFSFACRAFSSSSLLLSSKSVTLTPKIFSSFLVSLTINLLDPLTHFDAPKRGFPLRRNCFVGLRETYPSSVQAEVTASTTMIISITVAFYFRVIDGNCESIKEVSGCYSGEATS